MKKALAPLAALALASGCLVAERPYDSMDLDAERFSLPSNFENYVGDGLRPVRGVLSGDMGPSMRGMNDIARTNGFHDEGYSNLEVIVTNDRGSAMALLDFQGGLDHPSLEPGSSQTFSAYDSSGSENGLTVGGVACSGDGDAYNWNYDEQITQVDVEVEETENPDVKRMNFTTHQGTDQAFGSVDIATR